MIDQIKNQISEGNKLSLKILERCMRDIELSINIINKSIKQNKIFLWYGNRVSAHPQRIQSGYLIIGQVICSQIEDTFLLLNG